MNRRSLLWAGVLSAGLRAASMYGQEAGQPETPALVTSPVSFIGITPCRVVDTRNASMPPGYGPPALSPGIVNGRTFVLAGQCGIPSSAVAVSLNVTVAQTGGTGYLVLYPQDGAFPVVSTLNYVAGQVVANAAIVPLGTGGAIRVVAGVSGTQVIIDTNGYYAGSAVDASNTFLGVQSGNATMTGTVNTGIGAQTLLLTTVGHVNTAIGFSALLQNDNSYVGGADVGNTAVGYGAMATSTTGYPNLAFGANTLPEITDDGQENVAVGVGVLANALGPHLYQEAAVGNHALANMGLPFGGAHSLQTAVGYNAGNSLTCTNGDNCQLNIFIDHPGGANDRDVIRVGLPLIQTSAYLAGVRGATVSSQAPLLMRVDPTGQLGTAVSSARYKEDVRNMSSETDRLRELRPVTFRYKDQPRVQYGLIAEEVERVLPDLVVCDPGGEPETVMYDELPAMLLNEFQKQDRRLGSEEAAARLRRQELDARENEESVEQARIRALRERIVELESGRQPHRTGGEE